MNNTKLRHGLFREITFLFDNRQVFDYSFRYSTSARVTNHWVGTALWRIRRGARRTFDEYLNGAAG